ncbi:MAG: hypothetical protein EOO24_40970 [Comamonadaceae bacterium]|nr:MAG: hypothetical protein EOO24_40970 [Comamonadaceae bacterium]
MNKLATELQRLFVLPSGTDAPSAPVDAQGRVRALVFELTRGPDWDVLGRVWRGVQTELDLPAPGIAVSGVDALQLWFSLAQPVPAARAQAFLQGLRQRFLADVDARRVRLWPVADATAQPLQGHAAPVPALQDSGNWSAFVAPDLVPVFGDTPWLDIPPNEEGQAHLLRVLVPIQPVDFEAALTALGGEGRPGFAAATASTSLSAPAAAPMPTTSSAPADSAVRIAEPVGVSLPLDASASAASEADSRSQARRFLLQVMHDEGVAMALRIDAARALLQPAR